MTFRSLVNLNIRGWDWLSISRVGDRPTRAADHLTKDFGFVVAQKPDLLKLAHAMLFNKGLGCSLRESNTGHNPAHHDSVVHDGKWNGTAYTEPVKKSAIGRFPFGYQFTYHVSAMLSVTTEDPLGKRKRVILYIVSLYCEISYNESQIGRQWRPIASNRIGFVDPMHQGSNAPLDAPSRPHSHHLRYGSPVVVGSSNHARAYSRFCEYVEQRTAAADIAGIGIPRQQYK